MNCPVTRLPWCQPKAGMRSRRAAQMEHASLLWNSNSRRCQQQNSVTMDFQAGTFCWALLLNVAAWDIMARQSRVEISDGAIADTKARQSGVNSRRWQQWLARQATKQAAPLNAIAAAPMPGQATPGQGGNECTNLDVWAWLRVQPCALEIGRSGTC